MLILALETATDVCSVALADGSRPVVTFDLARARAHSENLIPMVEAALATAHVRPADLDAIAVSMGPGSYTGLRIGVSSAKGLAVAADARLVGVGSLAALAARALPASNGRPVCVAFAARREEVFTATYGAGPDGADPNGADPNGAPVELLPVAALTAPDAAARHASAAFRDGVVLAGDGAERIAPAFAAAGIDATLLPHALFAPSAVSVALLAARRLAQGFSGEDVAAFEPFYLKEFEIRRPQPA